jgi:hypothetical protein
MISPIELLQPQDFRHGTNSPLLFDTNGCRKSSQPTSEAVLGNSQSHIFQWPGCPYYSTISPDNQVPFPSPESALLRAIALPAIVRNQGCTGGTGAVTDFPSQLRACRRDSFLSRRRPNFVAGCGCARVGASGRR